MKKGLVLLEIFIFIGFIALIASISIQYILETRIAKNEKQAYITLRTIIATALENYAKDHNGQYPTNEEDLVSSDRPYLNTVYNAKVENGYTYNLELTLSGYNVQAWPIICGKTGTGTEVYTLTTGGVIQESACASE